MKVKKLVLGVLVALIAIFVMSGVSFAYDGATAYTLTVTTNEVTGSLADGGTITPDLAGWKRIVKVEIAVVSTTTAQHVNFYYNTGSSTETITLNYKASFTTDDAGTAPATTQTREIDFSGGGRNGVSNAYWKSQNVTIRKTNVNSAVQVTVWYL